MDRGTSSAECRVVFLLAAGEKHGDQVRELLQGQLDWQRVLFLARYQKASAALSRIVGRGIGDAIPDIAVKQLHRQRMVSDMHMLHLAQRTKETLELLSRAGLSVMLLKGAALGASVYGSFTDRPMADVDLLVRDEDISPVMEVLADAGWNSDALPERDEFYTTHHHLPPLVDARGSGHKLEVHHRSFPPPNPFVGVDREIWEKAESAGPGWPAALIPSRPHCLVYACIHYAWSHQMRKGAWRTFRDVDALASDGIDWDAVLDVARRWKAQSCCYWTMRLAQKYSGVAIPSEIMRSLAVPNFRAVETFLDRHFLSQIAPGESVQCPSVRLNRTLWRSAIRPKWSGHHSGTPEEHGHVWVEEIEEARRSGSHDVYYYARSARSWWKFVRGTR